MPATRVRSYPLAIESIIALSSQASIIREMPTCFLAHNDSLLVIFLKYGKMDASKQALLQADV